MSAKMVSVFYVRQIVPREKTPNPNPAPNEEELKPHVVDVARFFERSHAEAEVARRGSNAHFMAEVLEKESDQHPAHRATPAVQYTLGGGGGGGGAGTYVPPPSRL